MGVHSRQYSLGLITIRTLFRIHCNPGYDFVSDMNPGVPNNNYLTCGPETQFEWSHQRVNKSATVPGCTGNLTEFNSYTVT